MKSVWLIAVLITVACGDRKKDVPQETPPKPAFTWPEGHFQASLASPGGPLGFGLIIAKEGASPAAWLENGEEKIAVDKVIRREDSIVFDFSHYDASITAKVSGGKLRGEFAVMTPQGQRRMPFRAAPGEGPRFPPPPPGVKSASPIDPSGSWKVTFSDTEEQMTAVGMFRIAADKKPDNATGTVMTASGDHRFLSGDYYGGVLRLSAFDGAHAFLYQARVRPDGQLEGDFWSLDAYHATWVAERLDAGKELATLPDPFAEVTVTNPDKQLHFSFPSIDGDVVKDSDKRFAGKVVIVEIFGTWCPNCNDAAPLLAEWHRRYRDRGLEVVGLAYEYTGKPKRDMEMLGRFRDKHKIDYPLLLAGVASKTKLLADLSPVKAYPTTIFIGRDKTVRRIHSGFTGPGTGEHYTEMIREMEAIIEPLLDEAPPETK